MFESILPSLLIPKHIPTTNKKRFGNNGDGGYVLYEPDIKKSTKLISVGCGNATSFEEDILLYNKDIVIDIYDIDDICDLAKKSNRVNFYQEKITNLSEKLEQIKDNTVIQMDIEGSEFYVFEESLSSEKLKNISQLIIEIHFSMMPNNDHDMAINLLENINKTFDLIHIHGNNNVSSKIGPVPAVIECTYLNKNLQLNLDSEKNAFPINNLDYPNFSEFPDHDLSWWVKK